MIMPINLSCGAADSPLWILNDLLADTVAGLGENGLDCDPEIWAQQAELLSEKTSEFVASVMTRAISVMGFKIQHDFSTCLESAPWVCKVCWAEDKNNPLYLEWKLWPRMSRRHMPERVAFKLRVGHDRLEAWNWLYARWRRILELLLLPVETEFWGNVVPLAAKNFALPNYGGKNLLRKIANHLQRCEGCDDTWFEIEVVFDWDETENGILAKSLALIAVYEALRNLQTKRAKPDLILEFYLKLRSILPRVPWRAKTELSNKE